MRLDPKPSLWAYYFTPGHAYYLAGRYDEAAALLEKAVGLDPNAWAPRWWLIAAYGQLDRTADAQSQLSECARITGLTIQGMTVGLPLLPPELRYKNPDHWAKVKEGLLKAGLPE